MTVFGFEIRRANRPPEASGAIEATQAEVRALRERVEALERQRGALELHVTEATEKMLRYLKRVQELTRRGESAEPSAGGDDVLAEVLSRKFPRRN